MLLTGSEGHGSRPANPEQIREFLEVYKHLLMTMIITTITCITLHLYELCCEQR